MTGLPPLTGIARDMGAPVIKDGRCAGWYRGGKNPRSVKFDDAAGVGYDFGIGKGFGYIGLVEMVQGCDRRAAVEWLRTQYGLAKPDSGMRARRQAAHDMALVLAKWRWHLVQYLRAVRNAAWDSWQEAERSYRGSDRERDLPAAEWRLLRQRLKTADGIDSHIVHLSTLPTADLLTLRRRLDEGAR